MRGRTRVEDRPRRDRGRGLGVLLLCAGIGWSAPGAASTNLVTNSSFDENVFGWLVHTSYSDLSWSPLDFEGSPASGSALVVNTSSQPLAGWPHEYSLGCFPVDPGLTYHVGAWIQIPSDLVAGSAQMSVLWYSSSVCSGVPGISSTWALHMPGIWTPGEWYWVDDPALVPPSNAVRARVGLAVFKDEEGGSFEARFDDVLFAPEPSSEALRAAALVALGLALLVARATDRPGSPSRAPAPGRRRRPRPGL